MSTWEQTLKAEIARIARREVKKAVTPLNEALRRQRQQVVKLKRALQARTAPGGPSEPAAPGRVADEVKKARFSGRLIQKMRERLGLNRKEFGALLGVSQFAVMGWERDEFRPRGTNRQALVALRKVPARAAQQMLAEKKTVMNA